MEEEVEVKKEKSVAWTGVGWTGVGWTGVYPKRHSSSSRSSIDSLLDSRQADPVEVLLNLGFGGHSQDGLARIPERFLRPSKVV